MHPNDATTLWRKGVGRRPPQANPMTYFCPCFICESLNVCRHREPELIFWWVATQERAIEAAKIAAHAIAGPPEVPHRPKKINGPHKRFIRGILKPVPIPLLMDRIPIEEEYSGLRGW